MPRGEPRASPGATPSRVTFVTTEGSGPDAAADALGVRHGDRKKDGAPFQADASRRRDGKDEKPKPLPLAALPVERRPEPPFF